MKLYALNEYKWLKDHCFLSTTDRNEVLDDTFKKFILNKRSSANHVNNIVHDYRCLKNAFIGFTETQIKPSDSTSIIDDTLTDLNINSGNNDDKFLSLAYGC